MKGRGRLSLRSLNNFQNGLLILGLLIVPTTFLVESSFAKYYLGVMLFLIYFGFRALEKNMLLKRKKEAEILQKQRHNTLRLLLHLEEIFKREGFSVNVSENSILQELYQILYVCQSIEDFRFLQKLTSYKINYVLDTIVDKKRKEQSKDKKEIKYLTPLIKSLKILGLPEDTVDMVVIKDAYKKLIKKYHPDINPSLEAGQKTVELNLAYEFIVKTIKAS